MGWGHATNRDGREVGYAIAAVCDEDGCEARIDRGLAYVCGGMHDGGEHGCGRYFCGEHLFIALSDVHGQLCARCRDRIDADYEDEEPCEHRWHEQDGDRAAACPSCGVEGAERFVDEDEIGAAS